MKWHGHGTRLLNEMIINWHTWHNLVGKTHDNEMLLNITHYLPAPTLPLSPHVRDITHYSPAPTLPLSPHVRDFLIYHAQQRLDLVQTLPKWSTCTHRIGGNLRILAIKADAGLECSRVWPLVGVLACANPRTGFKSIGTKSALCGLNSSTLSQLICCTGVIKWFSWRDTDTWNNTVLIFHKIHGHMT